MLRLRRFSASARITAKPAEFDQFSQDLGIAYVMAYVMAAAATGPVARPGLACAAAPGGRAPILPPL